LAALQIILEEPQLCALVVLSDRRFPGDGFYWTIDVRVDAPVEKKIDRHKKEVERVRRHFLHSSHESPDPSGKHALPWSW